MLICNVVGARPNFMKMAPLIEALAARNMTQLLVHTGQHYDQAMSQVFFDELGMPRPDIHLEVGSDNQARQTAKIMVGFDEVCEQRRPDLVVVAGDVNSTVASALVAAKRGILVAHVEAGLRSGDRGMPEEINRIVTDHLADLLFTTEASGNENLKKEGIAAEKIHFVGNCMVDTLLKHKDTAVSRQPWIGHGLEPGKYVLLTLHRPSNVDDTGKLRQIMQTVAQIAEVMPVLFPVHPRTRNCIMQLQLGAIAGVQLCDPLPYLAFVGLMAKARVVLTDSGGIQEETTALNVSCLTLRRNTERPVTVTNGTNRLVGDDAATILTAFQEVLRHSPGEIHQPPLWDGAAAVRTAAVIAAWCAGLRAPGNP